MLQIALIKIQALPRKPIGLSPFEVMYGRPMSPPSPDFPLNLLPYQAPYTPL